MGKQKQNNQLPKPKKKQHLSKEEFIKLAKKVRKDYERQIEQERQSEQNEQPVRS